MTDNLKHSTSYFHEVVAKAFEMFKNGYQPVMETPFQPRRQGSAFVVEYKLVREGLDFDGSDESYMEMNENLINLIQKDIQDGKIEPLPSELLERMTVLREKAESNQALEDLAQQAQELDMGYDKQLTIHEKWEIDDNINFEADEEKKLAESESCGKMVYTKEALDELYWTDLQEVGRKFGVKQRDRKKLTRMILEAQEKENES